MKKETKRTILIILAALLFFLVLAKVTSGKTKEVETAYKPQLSTQAEWEVTKSTYVYSSPSFDSDSKGMLNVGDILILPPGVSSPECKSISEPGLTATLCYMRSERLSIEGWVLQKWIAKR